MDLIWDIHYYSFHHIFWNNKIETRGIYMSLTVLVQTTLVVGAIFMLWLIITIIKLQKTVEEYKYSQKDMLKNLTDFMEKYEGKD